MKKIYILLCILIFSSVSERLISEDKFYFDADFSVFKGPSAKSIVEVYFSFTQKSLVFIKSGNDFVGVANTQIIIKDVTNSNEVFNEIFGLQSVVKDTASSKLLNRLIGQQNLTIPSGSYEISFIGFDQNKPERKDTIKLELNLAKFDETKSSLSMLQLSSMIDKSNDKASIFYKNGLEITPNPNLLFGNNIKKVYYYLEVYYPAVDFKTDNCSFIVSINDLSGKRIAEKKKNINMKNDIYAETGLFPIDSIPSGSYILKAELSDNSTGNKVIREKKFYIYNSLLKKEDYSFADDKDYLQSEFILLKENDVEDEFNKIIYIRSNADIKEWDNLKTLEDKRKFLFKFWKRKDTNLLTPRIESRDDYFKRIKEANKLFKQNFTDGWKSDRGRIYVIYGQPTDVEKHFMEADTKNYEIWTYDYVEGGTICVFGEVTTSGEGTYNLIHSTMRNEFKDPNWMLKLKK